MPPTLVPPSSVDPKKEALTTDLSREISKSIPTESLDAIRDLLRAVEPSAQNSGLGKDGSGQNHTASGARSPSEPAQKQDNLYSSVNNIMAAYMKGHISQGELVRQLKTVNNQLAHNLVKDSKQGLNGSAALATSPEHKSQLPQSKSLLDDSATNVKAAGVEESGTPTPRNDESPFGSFADDGALSTEADKKEMEKREIKVDNKDLNAEERAQLEQEQAQRQQAQSWVEQNRRDTDDGTHLMTEANERAEEERLNSSSLDSSGLNQFLRISRGTEAEKLRYLNRQASRGTIGNIPKLDKSVGVHTTQLGQLSVNHGMNDANGDLVRELGKKDSEVAQRNPAEAPAEDIPVPDWFKPIEP
jgi:hypothetical protein